MFRSMEALHAAIGRYYEAGMRDFFFIDADGMDHWKEQTITTEHLLNQIALDAIPAVSDKR